MSTEPIGLARDLAPKGVMRAQIGQTDLAVWRSTSGVVSAWENRCPHRGMRLSHGFVRGESLACAYHGWHYDCGGKCHYIPAHPELEPPATIRPNIYSVVEQSGLLWVSTTGTAKPIALPDHFKSVRSITLACDINTASESFASAAVSEPTLFDGTVGESIQNENVLALNNVAGVDGLLVLFQQSSTQNVTAHLLACEKYSTSDLVSISRWSESVRRAAEKSNNLPNFAASTT